MAKNTYVVAKRYSRALWLLATSAEQSGSAELAESWAKSLDTFTDAFRAGPELKEFLDSPVYPVENKKTVVDEISAKMDLPKGLRDFTSYLLSVGRLSVLPEINDAFREIVFAQRNYVSVKIESALPLGSGELQQITARLEKALSKKISATVETVPELLAGLRIQVGGSTLDSSLRASLETMQNHLLVEETQKSHATT